MGYRVEELRRASLALGDMHHAHYVVEITIYHNDNVIFFEAPPTRTDFPSCQLQAPRTAAIGVGVIQDATVWAVAEQPPGSDPQLYDASYSNFSSLGRWKAENIGKGIGPCSWLVPRCT